MGIGMTEGDAHGAKKTFRAMRIHYFYITASFPDPILTVWTTDLTQR